MLAARFRFTALETSAPRPIMPLCLWSLEGLKRRQEGSDSRLLQCGLEPGLGGAQEDIRPPALFLFLSIYTQIIKVKWDLERCLVFRSTLFSAVTFAPVTPSLMHVSRGHKARGDGCFSDWLDVSCGKSNILIIS